MAAITPRVRNDPAQYDDLAGQWWDPRGTFAMLHWLARARAALVPPAARPGAVLVDVGCGAGLLAPHVTGLGYRLVGVDLTRSALVQAAEHGVTAVQGDACVLPLADGCADVVCAGEILEHVVDLRAAVREACRVLRPGGVLVVDTIAATFLARLLVITIAERIPRAAPPGLHDPALFVDRQVLISECARHGVRLQLTGLRPGVWSVLRWLRRRQPTARMVRTWSTAVLFQGRGTKENRIGSGLRSACAGQASGHAPACSVIFIVPRTAACWRWNLAAGPPLDASPPSPFLDSPPRARWGRRL
jgi:2-polyprenyl-6-hydroxyphenyl methylase / 3-demethylubiquinone-9 3-methyltransferase